MGQLPPGWYADERGAERWWDGEEWTSRERQTPPLNTDGAHSEINAEAAAHGADVDAAPGWYPQGSQLHPRWWDGKAWTGYRIVHGEPRSPFIGGRMGILTWCAALVAALTLAASIWLIWSFTMPGEFYVTLPLALPVMLMLVLTVCLIVAAVQAHRNHRRHRRGFPNGDPVTPDVVRPLAGEVEAPGAGWYPAPSDSFLRWWTGERWAEYVVENRRMPRPSYGAVRSYRGLRWAYGVLGSTCLAVIVFALITQGPQLPLMTALTALVGVPAVALYLFACAVKPRMLIADLRSPAGMDEDAPATATHSVAF